jgi:hypothetical protein
MNSLKAQAEEGKSTRSVLGQLDPKGEGSMVVLEGQ